MPFYEYRCANGHTFEVMQSMSDDPLSTCTSCGAPVQRVFHPVAVHFKGSGFYTTDYGRRRSSDSTDSKEGTEPAKGKEGEKQKAGAGSKDSGAEKSKTASESSD